MLDGFTEFVENIEKYYNRRVKFSIIQQRVNGVMYPVCWGLFVDEEQKELYPIEYISYFDKPDDAYTNLIIDLKRHLGDDYMVKKCIGLEGY